jgi:hypothetical protein
LILPPEELAHYLKELGANKTTYLSYLKGKDKYINKSDFYALGMCSLCDKLNNKFKRRARHRSDHKYYKHFTNWLNTHEYHIALTSMH